MNESKQRIINLIKQLPDEYNITMDIHIEQPCIDAISLDYGSRLGCVSHTYNLKVGLPRIEINIKAN